MNNDTQAHEHNCCENADYPPNGNDCICGCHKGAQHAGRKPKSTRNSPRWYVVATVYGRAHAIFGPFYQKLLAQGNCNLNSDFYHMVKDVRFGVDTHTNLTRVYEDSFAKLLRKPKGKYKAADLGIEHKPKEQPKDTHASRKPNGITYNPSPTIPEPVTWYIPGREMGYATPYLRREGGLRWKVVTMRVCRLLDSPHTGFTVRHDDMANTRLQVKLGSVQSHKDGEVF